jgi:hypothetical protein
LGLQNLWETATKNPPQKSTAKSTTVFTTCIVQAKNSPPDGARSRVWLSILVPPAFWHQVRQLLNAGPKPSKWVHVPFNTQVSDGCQHVGSAGAGAGGLPSTQPIRRYRSQPMIGESRRVVLVAFTILSCGWWGGAGGGGGGGAAGGDCMKWYTLPTPTPTTPTAPT